MLIKVKIATRRRVNYVHDCRDEQRSKCCRWRDCIELVPGGAHWLHVVVRWLRWRGVHGVWHGQHHQRRDHDVPAKQWLRDFYGNMQRLVDGDGLAEQHGVGDVVKRSKHHQQSGDRR